MEDYHIDFETFSEVDLKKAGAWKYAENPSTEIMMLGYGRGQEQPKLWLAGDPAPEELLSAIRRGARMVAHNVEFERAHWENICVKRFGWPEIEPMKWRCTMARAASRALPLGLDELTRALDLVEKKDRRGKQLINLFCKPQKATKKQPARRIRPEDKPEEWEEFKAYCLQDVRAEQEVDRLLGPLLAANQRVFTLNGAMNARGMYIDLDSVDNALAVVAQCETRLTAKLREVTFDEVETHNQRDKILALLHRENVHLDDLTSDTVEEVLPSVKRSHGEDSVAYQVLDIRQKLAKASSKKLGALRDATCRDGRVRGLSQYHGAFTGRNAGRLVQPLNLPRPKLQITSTDEDGKVTRNMVPPEQLIEDLRSRDAEYLEMLYGDPMQAVADALRPMFMAAPGKLLCAADLSAIEAVGLAALAGQESKLDVFRRGEDPYCAAATAALGRLITKKTDPVARQEVGKPCLSGFSVVISSRGLVFLQDVRKDDLIWDGVEWVSHLGVAYKGEKPTLNLNGLEMTPDHLVLCGDQWTPSQFLEDLNGENHSLSLATGKESWRSLGSFCHEEGACTASSSSAGAGDRSTWSTATIFKTPSPLAARIAGGTQVGRSGSGNTPSQCRTTSTAADCSIDWPRLLRDATARAHGSTPITVAEAFTYMTFGAETKQSSCGTFKPSKGGTSQNERWTGQITTKGTSPATSDLSPEKLTPLIDAASQNYRKRLPVFDLLSCGPRRRFVVLSAAGPLVVHNCELAFGYGGGVGAWRNFDDSDRFTDDEVKGFQAAWRRQHAEIARPPWDPMVRDGVEDVGLWYGLERAFKHAMVHGEASYRDLRYKRVGMYMICYLPSGRPICYYDPKLIERPHRWREDETEVVISYMSVKKGRWQRVETWGGKLAENVTQAACCDILIHGHVRAEPATPALMTIYDELIVEIDEKEDVERCKRDLVDCMVTELPPWCASWPIKAEAWAERRYRKG